MCIPFTHRQARDPLGQTRSGPEAASLGVPSTTSASSRFSFLSRVPRSSWAEDDSGRASAPGGGSAPPAPRLSRLSYYQFAAAEIERLFSQKTMLPARWSFFVPDFHLDGKDLEHGSGHLGAISISRRTATLAPFRVDFAPADRRDPKNWSAPYRVLVTAGFAYTALAAGIYSTAYSSGVTEMAAEFGIARPWSSPFPLLGISLYLAGLAMGALFMAPLSETFGRRPMYIAGLAAFVALIPLAALATDFTTVIAARFLGAVAGSVMLANGGGSILDISAPRYLPLTLSVFSFGPLGGPVLGPLIGGYLVRAFGWRSLDWFSLLTVAPGALFIMMIPETYRPTILRRMAARRRLEEGDDRYWTDYDDAVSLMRRIRTAVSRPFVLSFTEPVLMFWNIYISVVYAVVQLVLVAFPIVYRDERGWDVATSGLALSGVFVGIALVLVTEPLLRRLVDLRHPVDPVTGRQDPEAMVLLICIGAVLAPAGQLMFALTSLPTRIPLYVGIVAGVPLGYGFGLVFIYGTTYISNVFGMYSTSALAGNLIFRSVIGAVLVVFGRTIYHALTPQIAGVVVGVVEMGLMPVPFIFYLWGKPIRKWSRLICTLEEQARKIEAGGDA